MARLIHQSLGLLLLLVFAGAAGIQAQGTPSGKTLAATMDVYVFPKQSQAAAQQSQDEATCYEWATGNLGMILLNCQNRRLNSRNKRNRPKRMLSKPGGGPAYGVRPEGPLPARLWAR
jgi:hypothetical protein